MKDGISKRQFLAGAGIGAALAAFRESWIAPDAMAALPVRPSLAIHDSRLPESRRFAVQAREEGLRLFDIAGEEERLWQGARAGFGLVKGDAVTGMTRWSDWLIVRGLLHERGLRVRHEMRIDCCTSGDAAGFARLTSAPKERSRVAVQSARAATLFAWIMA